jgi:competence protein ComEA
MKKFFLKSLGKWFGYTRRERRSSFFLLLLTAIVAGIRFIVPESNMSVEMIAVDQPDIPAGSVQNKRAVYTEQENRQAKVSRHTTILPDINTCDSASLEALPGIGPVLSARIIKYRKLLGGYASIDQLKEVYGLSEETFGLIRKRVRVDTAYIRKININSADYKQLIRFPYLERHEVSAILKYRELKGALTGMTDLVDNKLIVGDKIEKIRPYLEFD